MSFGIRDYRIQEAVQSLVESCRKFNPRRQPRRCFSIFFSIFPRIAQFSSALYGPLTVMPPREKVDPKVTAC